jgi:hypothetical protein
MDRPSSRGALCPVHRRFKQEGRQPHATSLSFDTLEIIK